VERTIQGSTLLRCSSSSAAAADHTAVHHIGEGIPEPDKEDTPAEGTLLEGNRWVAPGILAARTLGAGTLEEGIRVEGTHAAVAEGMLPSGGDNLLAEVVEGILSNQIIKKKWRNCPVKIDTLN